jgi:phenylacetate-coenzyme A ligase PaaK-like adenylate-forming protein
MIGAMVDYAVLRRRHVGDLEALLPPYLHRLDWTPRKLQQEREARLRHLLGHTLRHSAWHRGRLGHLDPSRVTERDLASVPAMTQHDLMANWSGIVTDPRLDLAAVESHLRELRADGYLLGRYHALASRGSGSVRGVFVYDWEAWALCMMPTIRWSSWQRKHDPSLEGASPSSAHLYPEHPGEFDYALRETFLGEDPGMRRLGEVKQLERVVAALNQLRPTYLLGPPSRLEPLAAEVLGGRLRIAPKRVLCSHEPLVPQVRATLEDAWQAPVVNAWIAPEAGVLACGCDEGRGMHLTEDLLIVEPVDASGRPTPPGVRAEKVYVTNLFNLALPLIRYEVDDPVTLLEETCTCGCTHSRIDDIVP